MKNAASYIKSVYSSIFQLPLEQLLKVGNSEKDGNPIPSFDESLLIDLCSEAQAIFENEGNILQIDGDSFIVGDIHGSYHDLLRILKYTEKIPSKVLFLGDYVDRGYFSLECITILFALKVSQPDKIFLIRGNHEVDAICSQYGFKEELLNYHNPKKTKKIASDDKIIYTDEIDFDLDKKESKKASNETPEDNPCDEYFANRIDANCYKYTEKLYNAFITAFSYLPISAIVNKSTFCIHGGICPTLDKVENINTIVRPIKDFDENPLFTDVVWSDPTYNEEGWFRENQRGRGHSFNGAALVNFLKKNSFKRIIRAHECVKNGTQEHFNQKCITVFSASSYCKPMSNRSGFVLLFKDRDNIDYYNLDPLLRLSKADALYYKVQSLDEQEKQQPRCFAINPARIMLKCSPTSLSNLKLVPNSSENKNLSNRPRILHYNSATQGEISLDLWKTPNPKKSTMNPIPRMVSRPIINAHMSQGKRRTQDIIKKFNFAPNSQANLLNNDIMSRSVSIPDYSENIYQTNNNTINNQNNDHNNDLNKFRRKSLPDSNLDNDIENDQIDDNNNDDDGNNENQLGYYKLNALPKLKSTD